MSLTVVIDGSDTGVSNHLFADGATFADLIGAVYASAANHGDFIAGVADLTWFWVSDGLISGAEAGAIKSAAAGAS
jgi:hypothetical protein